MKKDFFENPNGKIRFFLKEMEKTIAIEDNLFLSKNWFEKLPISFKEILEEINDKNWSDDDYDMLLDVLESEINHYLIENNGHINESDYLLDYLEFARQDNIEHLIENEKNKEIEF